MYVQMYWNSISDIFFFINIINTFINQYVQQNNGSYIILSLSFEFLLPN